MKRHILTLVSATVALMSILASCGPDLKPDVPPTPNDTKLEILLKKGTDKVAIAPGERGIIALEVHGASKEAPVTLSFTGDNAKYFSASESNFTENKAFDVTFSANELGEFPVKLVAVRGNDKFELSLTGVVAKAGTLLIVESANTKKTKEIEPIIDLGSIEFAEGYDGTRSASFGLVGRGIPNEKIEVIAEENEGNAFKIETEPARKLYDDDARFSVTVTLVQPSKSGEYKATLVARYGATEKRIQVKAKVAIGPKDVITPPSEEKPSKVKAFLKQMKGDIEIKNGSTLTVKAVTINNNNEYVLPMYFKFPEGGYHATITPEKAIGVGMSMWCMGGLCASDTFDIDINGEGKDKAPDGSFEEELAFHLMQKLLVKGYKNKLTFNFTKGSDSYSFVLVLDL